MIRLAVRSGRYTSFICLKWRLTGLPLPFGILSAGAPSGQCPEVFPHNFFDKPINNIQESGQILQESEKRFVQKGENAGDFFCTLTKWGLRAIINCICLRNARSMPCLREAGTDRRGVRTDTPSKRQVYTAATSGICNINIKF